MFVKKSSTCVFLLVGSFALVACKDGNWDHFMFAQAWPPGTCADAGREHHTCHVGSQVKTWTIHGLWPSLGDTKGPTGCNNSWPFDFSKIASLTGDLKTYWPNLFNDTTPDSFWQHEWSKHGTCCTDLEATSGEHNYFSSGLSLNKKYDMQACKEWEKHGTCSTNLPATSNEYKYFKQSLDLNRKYDLKAMLSESNVVPSDTVTYSFDDFINAVQKKIGFKPVIQCTLMTDEKTGQKFHIIDQIQICLNKDFTPRSCFDNTVYPLGYYHSKGGNSTDSSLDKDGWKKNDVIGRRSHHHYYGPPQSSCSKKYDFYYPPIHAV